MHIYYQGEESQSTPIDLSVLNSVFRGVESTMECVRTATAPIAQSPNRLCPDYLMFNSLSLSLLLS